jgi:prepilin-type processing-associated H-X9-DG protein
VGNAKKDLDTRNLEAGVLFPYNKSDKIYVCPSDTSLTVTSLLSPKGVPRTRTCSMDYCIGGDPTSIAATRLIMKATDFVNPSPSRKSVFWDEDERSCDNGAFGINPRPSLSWFNLPGHKHNNGCGVSFFDGHSEIFHWLGTGVLAIGQGDPGVGKAVPATADPNSPADMVDIGRVEDSSTP